MTIHDRTTTATTTTSTAASPAGSGRLDRTHDGAGAIRRLRRVLDVDAATSAVSGLAVAVAAGPVDDLLGTDSPGWVRAAGVGFLAFAGAVAWVARSDERSLRRWSLDVVIANVAFVVAMVVGLVLGAFSGWGVAVAIAVAVHVDLMAALQWRERRRLA